VTDVLLPGYSPRVEGNQSRSARPAKALAAAQRPVLYGLRRRSSTPAARIRLDRVLYGSDRCSRHLHADGARRLHGAGGVTPDSQGWAGSACTAPAPPTTNAMDEPT